MIDAINRFDEGELRRHILTSPALGNPFIRETNQTWGALCRFEFEGELKVGEQVFHLVGGIPHQYPIHLPIFSVTGDQARIKIPHLGPHGGVCYYEREGMVIDRKRPLEIFDSSVEKLIQTIEEGLEHRNEKDFLSEIHFYWDSSASLTQAISFIDLHAPGIRTLPFALGVLAFPLLNIPPTVFVTDNEEELISKTKAIGGNWTYSKGYFLPLSELNGFSPPEWGKFYDEISFENEILNRLKRSDRRAFQRLREKNQKSWLNEGHTKIVEFFLISIPISQGNSALVGALIKSEIEKKGVGLSSAFISGEAVEVIRMDQEFLIQRGGGNAGLSSKKVLVVGCGAVGGTVASELAKAGVGKVDLCDYDRIDVDNVFRHQLGVNYGVWGFPKTAALGEELKARIPFLQSEPYTGDILSLIQTGKIDLKKYDLIISATGNMTVELFLNEMLHLDPQMPPAIFTWVEALGIGGHSILVNNKKNSGCLNCLFTSLSSDPQREFSNRATFAAPDQYFGKTLAGCSSYFTPFSSLDANQTAINAVRLAVRFLTDREHGNPLISWKGASSTFLEQGYSLSPRFQLNSEELLERRYQYHLPNCPICNPKNETS